MDAKELVIELQRMCAAHVTKCESCPVYDCCKGYSPEYWEHIDDFVNKVEQWSKEHPRKTRLEDFFEKYPNAELGRSGLPCVMPRTLGYCQVDNCFDCPYKAQKIKDCWNAEVNEK